MDFLARVLGYFVLNTVLIGMAQLAFFDLPVEKLTVGEKVFSAVLAIIMTYIVVNRELIYEKLPDVDLTFIKDYFEQKHDLIITVANENSVIKRFLKNKTQTKLHYDPSNVTNVDVLLEKKDFYENLSKLHNYYIENFSILIKENSQITIDLTEITNYYLFQIKLTQFLEFLFLTMGN